jgi:hypothetical protein
MASTIYAFCAILNMASAFAFMGTNNTLMAAGLGALSMMFLIAFVLTEPPKSSQNEPNQATSIAPPENENTPASQRTPGEWPSLGEMAAQINKRKRRIVAGDTRLAELQTALYATSDNQEKIEEAELAEARKRSVASPEYAAWRLAAQRLADYEHELDTSDGK